MATSTVIRKRTTPMRGSSISATEVQAYFAKIADSPQKSKAFLKTIGISASVKNVLPKFLQNEDDFTAICFGVLWLGWDLLLVK